jgi:CCR4-NOT transcription complex subunit 1
LRLLVELYHFAELKLNLKFEIEVLCKALDIDLDALEPTTLYRNRPTTSAAALAEPPVQEYIPSMDRLPIGAYDSAQIQAEGPIVRLGATSPGEAQHAIGQHIESILSSLALLVTINPQLAPLNMNPSFKRAIQLAVDRAVREIIAPVVERSVTIAGISTRELAAKDFATEQSEEKLRKAGHLMAQKLAGSLALVTCKEPLRSNLGTYIRQFLADHGFSDVQSFFMSDFLFFDHSCPQQSVPEAVIAILVQDNIEVACQAIEKAAMDRAVADVEESFTASYEARRRHREVNNH